MDLELDTKRALVTGGTRGIGRAVVQVLAEAGCHIIDGRAEQANPLLMPG